MVSSSFDRLPCVVIVTGPPAAGKTTLAQQLAAALALPCMTKDAIKEVLFETLGWSDREWSMRLGAASMELLYVFLETQLAAHQSCIVEANFRHEFAERAFSRIAQRHPYLPIQLNCWADPAVLVARFRARATSGERHPGHHDITSMDGTAATPHMTRMAPLAIGGQVIELDMTDLARVVVGLLRDRIRRLWIHVPAPGLSEEPPSADR